MKIKNLKINQNAVSKLTACVLVGSLSSVLVGCGEKTERDNILKDTILENSCVVTFEGGYKDIAIAIGNCSESNHSHYYSITSGEYFCDETCKVATIDKIIPHRYTITSTENITNYLTPEEITKAAESGLDKNDIATIINRCLGLDTEETMAITR